jgi:hypothetical protein
VSGRLVWRVVAPSGVRGGNSRAGPRRGLSEIVPPNCGCRAFEMIPRVVGVELAPVAIRDHAKDA